MSAPYPKSPLPAVTEGWTFQPYDVLQVRYAPNGAWVDFSTLRTRDDEYHARRLLLCRTWEGAPADFRVVRGTDVVATY